MIHDRVTGASMRQYVEDHPSEVRAKTFESEPGLIHLSYKRKTFFKGLWNDYTRQCRGTVVRESDFEPVLIPFPKIFDYGIPESRIGRDTLVNATRKVNGFMIGVSLHPFKEHELLLSTTGSLDSPFIGLAAKWIEPHKTAIIDELEQTRGRAIIFNEEKDTRGISAHTFIFEVVDQVRDPHIVEEDSGLYLIGRRTNVWGSAFNTHPVVLDMIAERMGVMRPESHTCIAQGDVHALNENTRSEGYIVESIGVAYKLKSPYYRAIKYLGRLNDKKIQDFTGDREKFLTNSYQDNNPRFNEFLDLASESLQGSTLANFLSLDSVGRIMMLRKILNES